jgi:hypothetical protein
MDVNNMQGTIFDVNEFCKTDKSLKKYQPLIEAIDENHSMDIIDTYENERYPGLFIYVRLKISIPTNGVYENLDIRPDEEIMVYVRNDYPFSAPAVLFVRNSFPTNRIPHLNLGVADSDINLLNPCLYRGNIDEWFYQNGPKEFCDRVNGWFSDLVNGELIKEDGFETIRYENATGVVEADFDYLNTLISSYEREAGAYILGMKMRTDKYFKILNQEYSKNLDEDILPCIFVFDRENIVRDYFSHPFDKEKDLKAFPCECRIQHGIRKLNSKYYEQKKISSLKNVVVILAVKRPMQVIGGFSEYEFIAVQLSYDFKSNPCIENCPVHKMMIIQSLNKSMAERLSGTATISKKPIIMLGCGALGSKISMSLARMGYTEQHFYDEDILLPHNLVRHYESLNCAVGISKAEVMKIETSYMCSDSSTSHNENIFHVESFPDGLTIDCTASKRSLLWSVSSGKIKLPMLRTEIYMGGKMGLSLIEGKDRNPDVYDIQVSLYRSALEEDSITKWLTYEQSDDMRYHIGLGCSSDTMILDDATISNHASIVPHLINKYQDTEKGIVCVNIFDIEDLMNSTTHIYEMEPMEIFPEMDGWSVHIRSSIYQKVKKNAGEKTENAGIWIGCIEKRIRRITVVDMFAPKDNIRKTATVTMGKLGIKEYLKELRIKTNGLIGYIGEWHTHISGDASPSQRDRRTFKETQPDTEVFLMSIISPSNTQNFIIKGES